MTWDGESEAFVSEGVLEAWLSTGAEMDGAELSMGRRVLTLTPAVRFDGASDPDWGELLGRVIAEADLVAAGGERLGGSVLVGEVALDVQVGFIAAPKAV